MSSWLQTGNASKKLQEQEEIEAQKRKEESGKMFRFYVKKGEEARITIIDGELDADGYLNPPRFYEHTIEIAGKMETYVCPEKTNPEAGDSCPLCASGDRPSLISLFTCIDHREVPSKDGTKMYRDTPKLLALKPKGFELLAHKAKKYGGLAGCTFDVARLGDNSVATGDNYDLVIKTPVEELQPKYVHQVDDGKGHKTQQTFFVPANYEEEIVFRTGEQLRELGLGTVSAATTQSKGGYVAPSKAYANEQEQNTPATDYSKEL